MVEVEQPLRRLVGGQRRYGFVAQPHPTGVRIVLRDQLLPDRNRHVIAILAVPRHLLHGETAFGLDENRSAEKELERQRTFAQRVQVLGGGDLEVVGAIQRKGHRRVAGEARHHRGAMLPEERALGLGPAFAGPEQVEQPGGFGVGVGTPQRLDPDLAAQRDRVHRVVSAGGDPDARGQHGADGVRFGRHVENRKVHVHVLFGHGGVPGGVFLARAWMSEKKPSMNARASWPPSNPRQSRRSRPTNS